MTNDRKNRLVRWTDRKTERRGETGRGDLTALNVEILQYLAFSGGGIVDFK